VEEGYDCEKHNTDFQKTGSQVLFCFSLIFSCFALLVVSTQLERVADFGRKVFGSVTTQGMIAL
jgi:hypothetical protein